MPLHSRPPLLLAVDQGTTNTKALLIDRTGKVVFRTDAPVPLATPPTGFVEQDPLLLWKSVQAVLAAAIGQARALGATVAGLALTNQRETALAWHRSTGDPLAPAISWQCRRSVGVCQSHQAHAAAVRRISGLPFDPVLSATKWAWMLENLPSVQQAAHAGELCLGTVDSWLISKLTGGQVHATDLTNASRTGLLDLAALQWSPEMLDLFGIPAASLARIQPSAGSFGLCTAIPELKHVAIVSAIGDSHAALAGHGAFDPGTIKATYGTGSSLMTTTPALMEDTPKLARTIAWSTGAHTQYALEGNIFMTGSAVQWMGEFLGLQDPTSGALALADTAPEVPGVYFVPGMVGLGAPHWRADSRGLLCGLGRAHTAAHMARAVVESIAYQVADVFFAMREAAGVSLPALHADGGVTRNGKLMQFQADLLGVPVIRSHTEELSALGAGYLGGLALGWWPSLEAIASLPRSADRIEPRLSLAERAARYAGWQQAIRRASLPATEAG